MSNWLERSELLFGQEAISDLKSKHVLVIGLGGVGAYAAEMLARAGVGTLTIADGDVVSESNLNRQLIAMNSTIGQSKARLMQRRLADINPTLKMIVVDQYLKDESLNELLEATKYDYVVDAIDTLAPKLNLIKHAMHLNLPLVSSMGSGGKTEPWLTQVADISKSYNCRLATILRKRLHRMGIYSGFKVVFSPEPVSKEAYQEVTGEQNKKSMVGTVSYMPPLFGCFAASVVIRDLLGKEDTPLGRDGKISNT